MANALSEDKTWHHVQYAITGDNETDAISGILAILNAIGIGPHAETRVLEYLAKRSSDAATRLDKIKDVNQAAFHNSAGLPLPQTNPGFTGGAMPYPGHIPGSSAMADDIYPRGKQAKSSLLDELKFPPLID